MSRVQRVSFVVRVVRDREGRVNGVIERVATGAKEAFDGLEVIGQIILRMLTSGPAFPLGSSATPPGTDPRTDDAPRRGRSVRRAATDRGSM